VQVVAVAVKLVCRQSIGGKTLLLATERARSYPCLVVFATSNFDLTPWPTRACEGFETTIT
jgi:hypothetical protein